MPYPNRLLKLIGISLLGTTLVSGCVTAPHSTSGRVVVADEDHYIDVRFSNRDREYIHDYYRRHREYLPPGLAKKGKIPPGHARKLARHDRLPRDIPYHYLPQELEHRLSRLPSGYARVRVGQDIVIFDQKMRVILDVLHDIH